MKIKAAQNQHLIFTKHHCLNNQNKESGMMNQICQLLCSYINLLLDREETLALFPHLLLGREETLVLFPHLQVDNISLLFPIISRILFKGTDTMKLRSVMSRQDLDQVILTKFCLLKSLHQSG